MDFEAVYQRKQESKNFFSVRNVAAISAVGILVIIGGLSYRYRAKLFGGASGIKEISSSTGTNSESASVIAKLKPKLIVSSKDLEKKGKALLKHSENGNLKDVRALLDAGADIEANDKDGMTALLWACQKGHLEMVELLLENHANIEAKDSNYGRTALFWASSAEIVKLLLKKGADIEAKDSNFRETPLHLASRSGDLEVVRLLLEKGADIEAKDSSFRETPLHLASQCGHLEVVRLLLEKGAIIESKNKDGRTALLLAFFGCRLEMVEFLLERGANIEAVDNDGNTVIKLASKNKLPGIEKLISDQKKPWYRRFF